MNEPFKDDLLEDICIHHIIAPLLKDSMETSGFKSFFTCRLNLVLTCKFFQYLVGRTLLTASSQWTLCMKISELGAIPWFYHEDALRWVSDHGLITEEHLCKLLSVRHHNFMLYSPSFIRTMAGLFINNNLMVALGVYVTKPYVRRERDVIEMYFRAASERRLESAAEAVLHLLDPCVGVAHRSCVITACYYNDGLQLIINGDIKMTIPYSYGMETRFDWRSLLYGLYVSLKFSETFRTRWSPVYTENLHSVIEHDMMVLNKMSHFPKFFLCPLE